MWCLSCLNVCSLDGSIPGDFGNIPATGNVSGTMALSTSGAGGPGSQVLAPRRAPTMPKPKWHPPWKLYRVISGHLGWVRCVAVEPGNEWFATGSNDRVIKVTVVLFF